MKQYNLGGYNVGITDGKDLRRMPLWWPQMAWHIHTKFVTISSGIQVILWVLPQEFEKL
jgi:hypothetical protein